MAHLEKVLYTAKAHTTGGREGGISRTDDGRLEVRISLPGAPGISTNPERLFAAGWSTCFLSAIEFVAGKRKIALPREAAIDAEVDLGLEHDNYSLAAQLNVNLPGRDPQTVQSLADAAHATRWQFIGLRLAI